MLTYKRYRQIPPKPLPDHVVQIQALLSQGLMGYEIADYIGVTNSAVSQTIRKYGLKK